MSKWKMPHEIAPDVVGPESTPLNIQGRFKLPHEAAPQEPEPDTAEYAELMRRGPAERVLLGAGQRLGEMYLGAKQTAGMLRNLLPGEPSTWPEEVAQLMRERAPAVAAMRRDPYSMAGRIGADVGVGMAFRPGVRGGMAAGAALEGPLTPAEEPTGGDILTRAGRGAVLGGMGGALTSGGTSALGRGLNVARGRYADPEYARRMELFREAGVPASIGDITQSPAVMAIENLAQKVPLSGRREFLEQQAKALEEVVEGAPARIAGPVPSATREDIGQTLQRSIKEKYKQAKDEAGRRYEAVSDLVRQSGAPPVPPVNLQTKAAQLQAEYPGVFDAFQDSKAVARLRSVIEGTEPQKSTILGPTGVPITRPAAIDFEDMRWLDKRIGSMIRQGRQQMMAGKMDPEAFRQLTELQGALRQDVADWSTAIGKPEIAAGVRDANQFFRENVLPFRQNRVTRRVLQDEQLDTDTLAGSLFRLDAPTRTRQAVQFLTPEGVQAGRFHLLQEAERRAMNDVLESGYSPSKFLRGTQLGESGPVLYSPEELRQIDDLRELIRSSRRAASYAADPDTGSRLAGLAPLVSMKVPALARAFTQTAQGDLPIRYMLASPDIAAGGLGRMIEQVVRRSGPGAAVSAPELLEYPE